MKKDNSTLIDELISIVETASVKAKAFRNLGEAELNFKETNEKWSILECLEHLNRYGDFYLPEIQKAVGAGSATNGNAMYKSGFIGNYFANLMKVKDGKIVKMKTPADKNPAGSKLTSLTIDRFLKQQEMLKWLLTQARYSDLSHTKVPISLTKLIRLRLGDTLRFFVNHIERHVIQAENARDRAQAIKVTSAQ